jgi:hypothetical protein
MVIIRDAGSDLRQDFRLRSGASNGSSGIGYCHDKGLLVCGRVYGDFLDCALDDC